MCCWISDSSSVGEGNCVDANGCQDADPLKNTDICYVDIENSPLASHTTSGFAIFPDDAEGATNCMGFTWTNDEADPSNLYKGNLLFEVAMRYGLRDNGYTRSVPHAPMCACVEQMPVVSHADCKDLEAVTTYSVSVDDTNSLSITQSGVDITFNDCGNKGLAEHYRDIHMNDGYTIFDRVTGGCEEPESSFLAEKGIAKENSVKWVKVAGKGAYSDPSLSEQLLEGTHSSMTRAEFEDLWANSQKILLRQCKYCTQTHRYAYYKRYDENGLPDNVDILFDVKEHWNQYENNVNREDFDIFSTYDDAIQGKNAWESVNSNYHNIGFARDSGPDGYVYNQWNVWDTPLFGEHYGQGSVAFYVAMDLTASLSCFEGGKKNDFVGECTYENVIAIGALDGCSEEDLFIYLGVEDSISALAKIGDLCAIANSNAANSFFHFSSISNAGYQFDREFMNGGTNWNNLIQSTGRSRIPIIEENIASKKGITFPENLNNFDTAKSCDSMAVMCCWISDSSSVGEGNCVNAKGCQDADPLKNTDICYVDIENSPLASHTTSGFAIFPDDAEGATNCMGFTWTSDEADPSNLYKGNLLFEVAMRYGLKDNGYTRSVPHAPMCACVEQMPVVSHADCKDLEAVTTWSVSKNEWGFHISSSTDAITFNDCSGQDLADHYATIHPGSTISDRVKTVCDNAESSFISGKGFIKDEVEWA